MPWGTEWHPKTTKKEGEMKVLVRCARGVQVAYFTLHHTGFALVSPSTRAKRVSRVAIMFHLRPIFKRLQAVSPHVLPQLEGLEVGVAVMFVPYQPLQESWRAG